MEHQNIKVITRSKNTTMIPINYLLTLTSSPAKLIVEAEHVASKIYFQFCDFAEVSLQESIGS